MSYHDQKHARNQALIESLHSATPTATARCLLPIVLSRPHPLGGDILERAPYDDLGPGWGSAFVIQDGAALLLPGLGDDAA